MGRWRAVLCAAVLALAAGCGEDETEAGDVPALGYMAPDAHVVAAIPTDFDGAQLQRLERLMEPTLRAWEIESLRELVVRGFFGERGVEPLLGEELVIGAWGGLDDPEVVAAIETSDPERAKRLVDDLAEDGMHAAVDGDTLLVDPNDPARPAMLEEAIERRREGEGMDSGALPGDDGALLRMAGDPRPFVREDLPGAEDVPWVAALRSYDLTLRLEQDEVLLDAALRTDPAGLSEDDLPLATGEASPPAGDVEDMIAAANRDQSRTTVFLARLARAVWPDSRFVQAVEEIEADLGIAFEDEVLAQFNGPSASIATPEGEFAAVSDIADPDRMRELLPELAPRLPKVLTALNDALGSGGLFPLLLFAPDAPLTPGALGALRGGIEIQPRGEQLYEIRPIGDAEGGVELVVFGMIGDRFVVASDMRRARAVAEMPVSQVEGATGAGVARTDLRTWSPESVDDLQNLPTAPLGEAVGELEASLEGLEARLRVEVPGGL